MPRLPTRFPPFLLPILASGALALQSCASRPSISQHFSAPSVSPVRENVSSAQSHITNAQTHAQKAKAAVASAVSAENKNDAPALKLALAAANEEIDALSYELNVAQEALKSAQINVESLKNQIGIVTAGANQAIDDKNVAIRAQQKAEAQVKIDKAHAHRLKLYICSVGAALALLLIWKFKWLLTFLGPYGLIAYIAGPAAVFIALWMFL